LNLLPQLSQAHKKAVLIPDESFEPEDTQPEKLIFEQPEDAQPEKSIFEHPADAQFETSIFEQPPLKSQLPQLPILSQQHLSHKSENQLTPGLFLKVRIFV
jgi:hypothetical protein